MLKIWQFWTLTAIALLAAIFAAANMVLFLGNRNAQLEVAARQDYIQKSVQFEGLYREIVKALADLSVRNQDPELRSLLANHGIAVTLPSPAAPPAPAPAAGRK